MFADTVFAFSSKDLSLGVLFRRFIPCLSEAGECRRRTVLLSKSSKSVNVCIYILNAGLIVVHIIEVSETAFKTLKCPFEVSSGHK